MTTGHLTYEGSLLDPSASLWRIESADRLVPLMEHEAYFEALSEALHRAERSILILGWQFDPRTRLEPEGVSRGRQAEVGRLLHRLVKQKPSLEVRLLIWKSPLVIAASQGFYPHRAQKWFGRHLVHFELDQAKILGACHHQKLVIIDDEIAFCGGGDIATDRWDSELHLDEDPRRCQPSGLYSQPRHEIMCQLQGPIARALGDLVRERWHRATGETLMPLDPINKPRGEGAWPRAVKPLMSGVKVGITRTQPGLKDQPEVRENEAFYLDIIRRAQRLVYLENQYFTSPIIADALAHRLAEPNGPEVVLVTTARSPSWFDGLTMDTARAEVLYRLEAADHHGRFFAYSPRTKGGARIIVHSKMAIIDDKLLRIGSTNLNNRSQGLDTECDIAAEAKDEADRDQIRRFRQHSLAHFLGVPVKDYASVEAVMGGPGRAVEAFRTPRMTPLGVAKPTLVERLFAEWQLGDPMSSSDAWRPWRRLRYSQKGLNARSEEEEVLSP